MNAPAFPKPSSAKITDFETSFEATPVSTPNGDVLWADVRIDYVLAGGLAPQVTIRVPIPWNTEETVEQRRSKALRSARELIDHACRASGIGVEEPERQDNAIAAAVESVVPAALEGVAQELGLANPTTRPRSKKR